MADNKAAPHLSHHTGSCHCGFIRFEVDVDLSQGACRCNCTICTKLALLGVEAKPDNLKLLAPASEAELGAYQWGPKRFKYLFCKKCGAHCYSRYNIPEINSGDMVGVNVNCLDDVDPMTLKVSYVDGRHDNWMAGPSDKPWPIFTDANEKKQEEKKKSPSKSSPHKEQKTTKRAASPSPKRRKVSPHKA